MLIEIFKRAPLKARSRCVCHHSLPWGLSEDIRASRLEPAAFFQRNSPGPVFGASATVARPLCAVHAAFSMFAGLLCGEQRRKRRGPDANGGCAGPAQFLCPALTLRHGPGSELDRRQIQCPDCLFSKPLSKLGRDGLDVFFVTKWSNKVTSKNHICTKCVF